MLYRQLAVLLLSTLFLTIPMSAQQVERVEPPFWWRGMHDNTLQVMFYGEDIASAYATVESDVATLVATHRLQSPNYIFLDLVIDQGDKAAIVEISFMRDGQQVASVDYELRARKPGSAERQGFNNSDVMYLITPDRFVNGDESNDEVNGMREGYNRDEDFGRHGGDIEGIRQSLDYIKDMGFTAIWLNPVLENDQEKYSYHGYSTTDYYKVDPRYGSNEEYIALSNEASEMGIGMIM